MVYLLFNTIYLDECFCALVNLPSPLSIILCLVMYRVTFISMTNTLSIAGFRTLAERASTSFKSSSVTDLVTFRSRSSTVVLAALRVEGRVFLCV